MQKVITLRFQTKCKKCDETIPAGGRAVWLGHGKGAQHESCGKVREEIEAPKTEENAEVIVIDYAELRDSFLKFQTDPMAVYGNDFNREAGEHLRDSWKSDWAGCSIDEMNEWLQNGYHVQGLDGITSLIPAKPRRKLIYGEEGDELLIDLAWSGSDAPFVEWEKRVSKPGLSVEIYAVFSAYFPAKTIVAYQRWIARALQTLDESGVDMEVSIVNSLDRLYADKPNQKTVTKYRVRRAGEASDFSNWSAMFSPGGYRMLGIMGTGIHADRLNHRIPNGYGGVRDYGKWTVAYDEERNVIVIGNDNRNVEFPELEMTDKLRDVLAKVSG